MLFRSKCSVEIISSSDAKQFHDENHMHGHIGGSVHIALKDNDNIVQVLTMGKSRFSKEYEWECNRMTSKSGITVVGGASKLYKHFIKLYNPSSIITYSDLRFGSGKVYEKCGFKRLENTPPNYWYFNRNDPSKLFSRIVFQKHKLQSFPAYNESLTEWEILKASRYDRIWDCGKIGRAHV
mgnify:FL=1